MENTGIWVALAIIIFVLGSIFGLRVSPREKALGLMRELNGRVSAGLLLTLFVHDESLLPTSPQASDQEKSVTQTF